jgi:hypothetical protein
LRTVGTPRRIALALEQNDATVTISIADDGPGLPNDIRKRLFRRNNSAAGGSYRLFDRARACGAQPAALALSDRARGTEFTIELPGAGSADRLGREGAGRTTWGDSRRSTKAGRGGFAPVAAFSSQEDLHPDYTKWGAQRPQWINWSNVPTRPSCWAGAKINARRQMWSI